MKPLSSNTFSTAGAQNVNHPAFDNVDKILLHSTNKFFTIASPKFRTKFSQVIKFNEISFFSIF